MSILEYKKLFIEQLKDLYPEEEILSIFHILTRHFLKISRLELALHPNLNLESIQKEQFEAALLKIKKNTPIQYITENTEFYGLPFYVNKQVLIPRPETEELVDWIIKDNLNRKNLRILDIGCGSGCISISLTKNLKNAQISAIDFSPEALQIAKKNAEKNQVKINFFQQDILAKEKLDKKYDIIVSNPPYVRELEKADMQKNVLEYEPDSALYVSNEDPLIFYRKISQLAQKNLSSNGLLYFEINQYLGNETREILTKNNFSSELKKDIFGNDRMLKGKLNE